MITYNDFIDYLRDEKLYDDTEIALVLFKIKEDYGDYLNALESFGYEEVDRNTYDEALSDLTDYYAVDKEYGNVYEIDHEEYAVYDDEDEAEQDAIEQTKDIIEDVGFMSVNGWEDYVEETWFEDALRESFESYTEDIANETSYEYENRLVEECHEHGLIDDDDFRTDEDGNIDYNDCIYNDYKLMEMLTDELVDNAMYEYRYASAWYVDNFGEDAFNETVENNNLVDVDELAEYCVRTDGIAHTLSSYDGEEHRYEFEGTEYLIYRIN
jgi:hypothetical protein